MCVGGRYVGWVIGGGVDVGWEWGRGGMDVEWRKVVSGMVMVLLEECTLQTHIYT